MRIQYVRTNEKEQENNGLHIQNSLFGLSCREEKERNKTVQTIA